MPVFFDIAEMQAKGTSPRELKRLIQERYKAGHYKAPERAGVSYMLSPILRTYVAPDKDASVGTDNFPHIMHFAPHTSNESVGGLPNPYAEGSPRVYPFVHLHGAHGYAVQGMGRAETAAITKEHQPMLLRLCALKQLWCLPAKSQ